LRLTAVPGGARQLSIAPRDGAISEATAGPLRKQTNCSNVLAMIVREFGDQRAARTLELPAEPARGRFLRLPDGLELQIARVTLRAREPTFSDTPGWKAAEAIHVPLEPEDPDAMPAALGGGWKAVKT
jgi:hypothetical protein